VLGGLLLFLGLGFLVEWLHDAWFKLSKAEYGLVLLILITTNVAGLVASLGLGIVLAVALFAVSYSRIGVVKHALSGANYRSNVDRPRQDLQTLRRRGHWLYILELQGFIFFGTANRLLEQVRQRANDPDLPAPRYVVFDFRQVSGLDASAVLSFTKMKQLAEAKNMRLVFTHLPARVRRQLANEVLTDADRSLWHVEADLDHGVEWCEEQILQVRDTEETATARRARVATFQPESITGIDLRDYMERMDLAEGHYLIRQGDAPRGLFFVERGQVTALREGKDGLVIRLRKMGPGTVVGEMGLYLDSEASASILTNEPSTVYYLSKANLRRIEETAPAAAAALHRYIAEVLSERVSIANNTIQALLAGPEASSSPPQ
jgi:SulP family sulfate permease